MCILFVSSVDNRQAVAAVATAAQKPPVTSAAKGQYKAVKEARRALTGGASSSAPMEQHAHGGFPQFMAPPEAVALVKAKDEAKAKARAEPQPKAKAQAKAAAAPAQAKEKKACK